MSLVEVLVVMAIFGILSIGISMVIFSSQRSLTTGSGQVVLTSELRRGLDQISRELAESKPSEIQRPAANGAWDTQLIFRVPQDTNGDGTVLDANGEIAEWSNWITYQGDRANMFSRSVPNPPNTIPRTAVTVLASRITGVQFRRQPATADVVEVQLTASTITELGQVMSRTMGTRVKLRN